MRMIALLSGYFPGLGLAMCLSSLNIALYYNIIMAYVSKVDNGTGDAEFIYAFSTEGFPSCED